MKALIDGDILVYRVGFASQDVSVGIACARMDQYIKDIGEATGADDHDIFLTSTDKSNFRFKLFPEYKANRVQPKPLWYDELRSHVLSLGAKLSVGREADDDMADAQTEETVICSIDKDLDQIPGEHYNFVKQGRYTVTKADGLRFFYKQLLTGDRTDNIAGIEGVGPVNADRILDGVAETEQSYFGAVLKEYTAKYGGVEGPRLMLMYGQLLKIGGDLWQPEGLVNIVQDSKPSSDESLKSGDLSTSLASSSS